MFDEYRVSGSVETETSVMDLVITSPEGVERRIRGTGGTAEWQRDGEFTTSRLHLTSHPRGIKGVWESASSAFTGDFLRWPENWATAAQILLPTTVVSMALEPHNPPCGHIRDFGMAMVGNLPADLLGEWHSHESDITIVKTCGKGGGIIQVLGPVLNTKNVENLTDDGSSEGDESESGLHPAVSSGAITTVLLRPGDVISINPGAPHRELGDGKNIMACKRMYHTEFGAQNQLQAFPTFPALDTLRYASSKLNSFEAPVHLDLFPTLDPGAANIPASACVLVGVHTPKSSASVLGDGGVVLKTSPVVGTIMRLKHVDKKDAQWWLSLGQYMLTVCTGSVTIDVRGCISNTVDQNGLLVGVPEGVVHTKPYPEGHATGGVTRTVLNAGDSILIHGGTAFRAFKPSDIDSAMSVVNYLADNVDMRGKEVLERALPWKQSIVIDRE
jgi:hypothetical protein